MRRRHSVGITQASAASIVACLAVLCVPAVSIAADSSDPPAEAAGGTSELLARGAGYGQPHGEPRVRALQRRLRALGQRPGPVDGKYGPLTEAAVERLQRDSGLSVDGIVGPETRRVVTAEWPPLAPGAGYGEPGGSPRVRAVQRRLHALRQRPGPVDGRYGPRTQAAIERFQRSAGQPATGSLSSVTAMALARAHGDRPAQAAGETGRGEESRPGGRSSASPVEASGPKPGRGADSSGSESDQGRSRTPTAVADRATGTDRAEWTSPVMLLVLALALVSGASLLASWLKGRRRRPEAPSAKSRPVKPTPMPNGDGQEAKATPRASAPPSPEPEPRRNGVAAIGYVSVREPEAEDQQRLEEQTAAIDTACRDRGLVLKEIIRDVEQVDGTGPERPGRNYALQRLAAGDASCLVVAELGRLSPSAPKLGDIVEWLRLRQARLVSVDEGLDTGTQSGSEAAEKLVSLCVAEGRHHQSAEGGRPDPVPEPLPAEKAGGPSARGDVPALNARIRKMRASGMTLQSIASRLNAENVPTLRGGAKWRPSGVQAALGYRRPDPGGKGERNGNGSSGSRRARPRQPDPNRTEGGAR